MKNEQLMDAPRVHDTARLEQTRLGRWTEVCARSILTECEVGDYSYVMNDCELTHTRLGRFVSVAAHVRLGPANHPTWRAAQHHFTYRSHWYGLGEDDQEFFQWRRGFPVEVGHDAWLGHGVAVLPGVRVGVGAVVGACAVVTRDVPDYAIAVGCPARIIRHRFPGFIRTALKRIAWWDWSHETLAERLHDFRDLDVEAFTAKYDAGPEI